MLRIRLLQVPFRLLRCAVLLACGLVCACQSAPQSKELASNWPIPLATAAMVDEVPFFAQDRYQCGPAALATVLVASGLEITPAALVDQVYLPGRQGSLQVEIAAAARQHERVVYQLAPELSVLLTEISAGNPVLVLQNLGLNSLPRWHFAVVKGFDRDSGELLLNSGLIENYRVAMTIFERTWARAGHWGITVTPANRLPATATATEYLSSLVDLEVSNSDFRVLEQAYQTGLRKWPDNIGLLMGYGNLLLTGEHYPQAIHLYRQVLELQADYAPAHNNLAQSLLQDRQPLAAQNHARLAVNYGGRFSELYARTLDEINSTISREGSN
ncbi:MAG: PA2778 family cysteine peptidase [Pseudomonadales bacterium]|nr:PA2778 family cysteine peptidase [Pseudomonadales bacterium]